MSLRYSGGLLRNGRYLVDKLVYDFGPDAKLTEWFSNLIKDCPQKSQDGVVRACDAVMPDLPQPSELFGDAEQCLRRLEDSDLVI